MTRIAAGHPGIWPDICGENRGAIVEVLDGLLASLGSVRDIVAGNDRDGRLAVLERARAARVNLPSRMVRPAGLAELRLDRKSVVSGTSVSVGVDIVGCVIIKTTATHECVTAIVLAQFT